MERVALPAEDYSIAIVCALDKELFAVRALFDRRHDALPKSPQDPNHYALGQIATHNIVAAALPAGEYGSNAASSAVSHLLQSFPTVQFCLLVGIGAGVPSPLHDIRLGDVVVSQPTGSSPGVLQYDLVKAMGDGSFLQNGSLQRPPRVLMTAVGSIKSDPDLSANPLAPYLECIVQRNPEYGHPGPKHDVLYAPGTTHETAETSCKRQRRTSSHPIIHYGVIASGNQVVRNSKIRDKLRDEHGALCLEMEAAGIMNTVPCLVIRGICDYADSHKNDVWQEYASAAAAAYAKLLLSRLQFRNHRGDSVASRSLESSTMNTDMSMNIDRGKDEDVLQLSPETTPEERLRECKSFARRRPSWDDWPVNAMELLSGLQKWISVLMSALYVVKATPLNTKRSRDFAFELTDFLQHAGGSGVIYSLSSPTAGFDGSVEVLKSLISQILSHQPNVQSSCSRLSGSDNENRLFNVLEKLLPEVHKCFLVVELDRSQFSQHLMQLFRNTIQNPKSSLKIFVMLHDKQYPVPLRSDMPGLLLSSPLPASLPQSKRKSVGKRAILWRRLTPRFVEYGSGDGQVYE